MVLWNPGCFFLSSAFSPFFYISFPPHKYSLVQHGEAETQGPGKEETWSSLETAEVRIAKEEWTSREELDCIHVKMSYSWNLKRHRYGAALGQFEVLFLSLSDLMSWSFYRIFLSCGSFPISSYFHVDVPFSSLFMSLLGHLAIMLVGQKWFH